MRPADDPNFYRLPAPLGLSRESSIVLDDRGQFFHEGQKIEHPGLVRAFAGWIGRHPDDGRYILDNGYDFVYLKVLWAPRFAQAIRAGQKTWSVTLLSGEAVELSPASLCADGEGRLWFAAPDSGMHIGILSAALHSVMSELVETDSGPAIRFFGRELLIQVKNLEPCLSPSRPSPIGG